MANLEGKEGPDASAQDINNLKAECLFLRALAHYDLVRMYAQPYCYSAGAAHPGVPVVLATDPSAKPARNTVAEVYTQVIADLTEAESIIDPDYARGNVTDSKAVVTLEAIQALLSRVYLYSEQWQNAADYAAKVINSKKFTLWTVEDMTGSACFAEDVPNGGEIIFEVYGSKSNSYDPYREGLSPLCGPNGYGDAGASTDLSTFTKRATFAELFSRSLTAFSGQRSISERVSLLLTSQTQSFFVFQKCISILLRQL